MVLSLQCRLTPGLLAEGAASVSNILIPFFQGIGTISYAQSWLLILYLCRHDCLTLTRKFTKGMPTPGTLGQRLVLRVGWSCSYPNPEFSHLTCILAFCLGYPVWTAYKEFPGLCTWLPRNRGSYRAIEDEPQRARIKCCWCSGGRGAVDPDSSGLGRSW